MYIPTWILIGIIVVAITYFSRSKRTNQPTQSQVPTEDIWEKADEKYTRIVEDDSSLAKFLDDEINLTKAMNDDIIRLRHRFKDDSRDREFALLWTDFLFAMGRIISARQILDVTDSDSAFEDFHESVREPNIQIDEMDKKIRGLLGEDSHLARVLDKVRKKRMQWQRQ